MYSSAGEALPVTLAVPVLGLESGQVQETASSRRRKAGGKDARSATLEIDKRFPLYNRHGDDGYICRCLDDHR